MKSVFVSGAERFEHGSHSRRGSTSPGQAGPSEASFAQVPSGLDPWPHSTVPSPGWLSRPLFPVPGDGSHLDLYSPPACRASLPAEEGPRVPMRVLGLFGWIFVFWLPRTPPALGGLTDGMLVTFRSLPPSQDGSLFPEDMSHFPVSIAPIVAPDTSDSETRGGILAFPSSRALCPHAVSW